MALSEQELAEKMKARMEKERERQRRWRSRQKKKGLKSVAGMISQRAFDVIQKQKERTGEKVSDILERAILRLEDASPDNVPTNDTDIVTNNDLPPVQTQPDLVSEEEVVRRIKQMREIEHMPFNDIAKHLNNEGIATLSGAAGWDGKAVYDLHKMSK